MPTQTEILSGQPELSQAAKDAILRIRALRVLADRSQFKTTTEQFNVLMKLGTEDLLAVAKVLHKLFRGENANGSDPRR
jgi:hypothetical protein